MSSSYEKILTKGLQSSLATTEIEDGKLRFTYDTGKLFLDIVNPSEDPSYTGERIRISDIEFGYTEAQLLDILFVPLGNKLYIASDTGRAMVYISGNWIDIGPVSIEASGKTSSDNNDLVIWFSDTTTQQPKYSSITYNPYTDEFKVPKVVASNSVKVDNMLVTTTLQSDNVHKRVDFTFV